MLFGPFVIKAGRMVLLGLPSSARFEMVTGLVVRSIFDFDRAAVGVGGKENAVPIGGEYKAATNCRHGRRGGATNDVTLR